MPPPLKREQQNRAETAPPTTPAKIDIPLDKFATCAGCSDLFTRASAEPCHSCYNAANHSVNRDAKKDASKGRYLNVVPGETCPKCKGDVHIYEFTNGTQKNACKKCRKFLT